MSLFQELAKSLILYSDSNNIINIAELIRILQSIAKLISSITSREKYVACILLELYYST